MRVIKFRRSFVVAYQEIRKYILDDFGSISAQLFDLQIANKALLLSNFPELGVKYDEDNYIKKDRKNIIFYSFDEKNLFLKLIVNTKRNWRETINNYEK